MLRRVILVFIVLVAVSVAALAGFRWWIEASLQRPLAFADDSYSLIVERGSSLSVLARHLRDEGLTNSALPLQIYSRLAVTGAIHAGEYRLQAGDSLLSLVDKLLRGDVVLYRVTFPEGRSVTQWLAIVRAHPILSAHPIPTAADLDSLVAESLAADALPAETLVGGGLSAATLSEDARPEKNLAEHRDTENAAVDSLAAENSAPEEALAASDIAAGEADNNSAVELVTGSDVAGAEGWFFPDTYTFPGDRPALDIFRQAHQQMRKVLAAEWQQRQPGLPIANPYEALTLASIIEKETGVAHERSAIAGVFVRRLEQGMRLQTDPTVIYGMGERFEGNLTRHHLKEDTAFNTYRIAGLPPTPIANPGREAIHASLHPAAGSALYFVARGDGSHQFSDTLAEHNRAVRQFQLKRRSDYRSSPAPATDTPNTD